MHLNVSIVALVTCLTLKALSAVSFSEPVWKGDLGISMPMLNFSDAMPLEMPKAEAYLVTSSSSQKLIDKFNATDLWVNTIFRGRWFDYNGNQLTIAKLTHTPPLEDSAETTTRFDFYSTLPSKEVDPENDQEIHALVKYTSLSEIIRAYKPHRSKRRTIKELWFYETTNDSSIVCAFRPISPVKGEKTPWFMASLDLAHGENHKEAFEIFNEQFLDKIFIPAPRKRGKMAENLYTRFAKKKDKKQKPIPSEKELLSDDYRRLVVNYSDWNFMHDGNITVVDNLSELTRAPFISSLTNTLPVLQKAYKTSMPSPLATNEHIVAIRIFATQEEYLSYVGEPYKFTAAIWSPLHRELVMYLPEDGGEQLLQTVWHEAFHQYLSYASSMISAAPWINEGHAELFQNSHINKDGNVSFDLPVDYVAQTKSFLPNFKDNFQQLITMGYQDFYSGTQEERILKYILAWSIAYFIEVRAPEIRFKPYETLREDYTKALLKTKDMHEATKSIFTDSKSKEFIDDYIKFWNEL